MSLYVLAEGVGALEPAILIGAISALATALGVVAKTAYTEVRAERDLLRLEVLAALKAIMARMNEVTVERDTMIHEVDAKLDTIRRMIQNRKAST